MQKRAKVTKEWDGKALGTFLKAWGYSASMLKRMRQAGGIAVNGEFRRQIDPVFNGDEIIVDFPEAAPKLIANGDLNVPIVYEDEDVLVFDKPDGMLVHPAARGITDALGNYFTYLYPHNVFRPLGRLDKHTTGLCLVAKSRLAAVQLQGRIEKEYLALAEGDISQSQGTVTAPIARVSPSLILREVDMAKGQRAVTHFQVLERFQSHTLLALQLETGRTHQIRVHMAFLGHPLAGDTLYGGHNETLSRQALHCKKIIFFAKKGKVVVRSETPSDLAKCLKVLEKRKTK